MQKRCCCHQQVREKMPTTSMQSALVVSALPKEHFKESVGNVTISDISQNTAGNLKTTCVRNAEKRDILQCVAIPDNREVAPLADSHTVSQRMKAVGVVVESRTFEILTNKTHDNRFWFQLQHNPRNYIPQNSRFDVAML